MRGLKQHEQFEIEVLDELNSHRLLDRLIFGGGTMLRLCHELKRYSVGLDFYLIENDRISTIQIFKQINGVLGNRYDLTDSRDKQNTLLFEFRSGPYPNRLKIEINKNKSYTDFQKVIAFSPYSNRQVLLNALSLKQMMKNKISAFLDRKEARDVYDIEFMVRRGVSLPKSVKILTDITNGIDRLSKKDVRVKLGSLLPDSYRQLYFERGFEFLKQHIYLKTSEKKFSKFFL